MRCPWANRSLLLRKYHDQEWGVPEYCERRLFQALSLEIFQAGLRWELILRKRLALQAAFRNFNYRVIAGYSEKNVQQLLKNPQIIRNRYKIQAVVANAKIMRFLSQREILLRDLTWDPVNYLPLDHLLRFHEHPNNSVFIRRFLRSFKKFGFRRIGPKTLYSYLQATGVVNDHCLGCFRYRQINQLSERNWIEK